MKPIKLDPTRANRCRAGRFSAIVTALVLAGSAEAVLDMGAHAAEPSPWVQRKDEKPALSLDQTALSGQAMGHFAYEHINGSKSDWAISGSMALPKPNLVVMIVRRVKPHAVRSSVIKDMEYFAELRHFPPRYRPAYYALTTRFGELRGVAFNANADGIQKQCIGFHTPAASKLFVRGFFCSEDSAKSLPKSVACLVDRIRYVSQADEELIKADLVPVNSEKCDAIELDGRTDGAAEKPAKDVL